MNPTEGKLTEADRLTKRQIEVGYEWLFARAKDDQERDWVICVTRMALESLKAPAVTTGGWVKPSMAELEELINAPELPCTVNPDGSTTMLSYGQIGAIIKGLRNEIFQLKAQLSAPAPLSAVTTGERPVDLVGWDEAQLEALRRPVSEEKLKSMLEVCRLAIKDTSQGHHNTISTTKWVLAQTIYMALSAPAPLSSEAVERVEKLEVVASVAAKLIQDYEDDEEGEDVMLLALNVDDLRDAVNAIPNAVGKALLTQNRKDKK